MMLKYFKQRVQRFRRRKDRSFPNKCDICGLRAKYPKTDKSTDASIKKANELQSCGLASSFPRNIHFNVGSMTDESYTYFCALSNLKYWNKPFKKCPDWQLQLGSQITLSDHLAIHHSRNNTRIAIWLGVVASVLTLFSIICD
jgi:hypothetical protein